jgi:hypothetical protein
MQPEDAILRSFGTHAFSQLVNPDWIITVGMIKTQA